MVNLAASFLEPASVFGFAFSEINALQSIKWAQRTWQQQSRAGWSVNILVGAQFGTTGPGQMFRGFCIL